MNRIILSILLLICITNSEGQSRFYTKNGKVSFDATSANSPENIIGVNEKATSVIDITNGAMEFALLMKAFIFEKALMQEHFNENYVESDKFPKAVFKGSISNMKDISFDKDGSYKTTVKGLMTLHGVSKEIQTEGFVIVKNGSISSATADFKILLADYGILVPSLVKDKVSTEAKISVNVSYEPMKTL